MAAEVVAHELVVPDERRPVATQPDVVRAEQAVRAQEAATAPEGQTPAGRPDAQPQAAKLVGDAVAAP